MNNADKALSPWFHMNNDATSISMNEFAHDIALEKVKIAPKSV